MPPLETEIAEGTDRRLRMEYHMTEIKELCSAIKRIVSDHVKNSRHLRERTEICQPNGAQNRVSEVNAKQEESSQQAEEMEKKVEERPRERSSR